MITDAIIEFFLNPVCDLIQAVGLPDIEPIYIPEDAFDVLISILRPLGYFLPMKVICICMSFLFALDTFNIFWSLFLRIRSFASLNNWV